MYDTMGVSQICRKWNLLFHLNSMFYRIRLYLPQAFGKNDIILPCKQVLNCILRF